VGAAILKRSLALSGGGAAAAELLAGTALLRPAAEPLGSQLLDVVEEMAVAACLPVPAVYLLEREEGINAFVAGFAADSAVLCVTRGALDVLTRDELQAVVAHELSHVVNGDMALNARLTVQLQGLVVFNEAGRKLVDFGFGRGNEKGQAPIVGVLGLVLMGLGAVGGFFGSLFKGAISGERELLADAEAVQFTRNPAALLGAFKKIGGPGRGGQLKCLELAGVSNFLFNNFLFVEPSDALGRNPFLLERIRALEPDFDGHFPTTQPGSTRPSREAP
jgi:Zn-dependent protease with chaperone function